MAAWLSGSGGAFHPLDSKTSNRLLLRFGLSTHDAPEPEAEMM